MVAKRRSRGARPMFAWTRISSIAPEYVSDAYTTGSPSEVHRPGSRAAPSPERIGNGLLQTRQARKPALHRDAMHELPESRFRLEGAQLGRGGLEREASFDSGCGREALRLARRDRRRNGRRDLRQVSIAATILPR